MELFGIRHPLSQLNTYEHSEVDTQTRTHTQLYTCHRAFPSPRVTQVSGFRCSSKPMLVLGTDVSRPRIA